MGDDPWVPLGWPDHNWPGQSWTVGRHVVRQAIDADTVAREVTRLDWLRSAVACPETVLVDEGWLVTTLPIGAPAHRPEAQPDPDTVPHALGVGLRRIHELDPATCPFESSWSTLVDDLGRAVEEDLVRVDRLAAPYDRYPPAQLLDLVRQGRPDGLDQPVVAHGSPALSNLYLVGGHLSGVMGVHRLGRADRHLDLAIVSRQLQTAFGPDAVYGFYAGYGDDPDLVPLDNYVLIDAIRSAVDVA